MSDGTPGLDSSCPMNLNRRNQERTEQNVSVTSASSCSKSRTDVASRPGAARPRAEIGGVTPVPPFSLGHRGRKRVAGGRVGPLAARLPVTSGQAGLPVSRAESAIPNVTGCIVGPSLTFRARTFAVQRVSRLTFYVSRFTRHASFDPGPAAFRECFRESRRNSLSAVPRGGASRTGAAARLAAAATASGRE